MVRPDPAYHAGTAFCVALGTAFAFTTVGTIAGWAFVLLMPVATAVTAIMFAGEPRFDEVLDE